MYEIIERVRFSVSIIQTDFQTINSSLCSSISKQAVPENDQQRISFKFIYHLPNGLLSADSR